MLLALQLIGSAVSSAMIAVDKALLMCVTDAMNLVHYVWCTALVKADDGRTSAACAAQLACYTEWCNLQAAAACIIHVSVCH